MGKKAHQCRISHKYCNIFQLSGVLRTASGKPGEVICRIAEEEDAAMIITGARGMGKVHRTILGSVSDYLVHPFYMPSNSLSSSRCNRKAAKAPSLQFIH